MDVNNDPTIFNINQLRGALEQLDLNEVAKRTIELAEDYMPGCASLDASGNVHFAETMGDVDGLVLCQATEVDPDSPDEVPFWVASWLDELFPNIAERLRIALAEATWGTDSGPGSGVSPVPPKHGTQASTNQHSSFGQYRRDSVLRQDHLR